MVIGISKWISLYKQLSEKYIKGSDSGDLDHENSLENDIEKMTSQIFDKLRGYGGNAHF